MNKKIFFFLLSGLLSSQFVFGMKKRLPKNHVAETQLDDDFFAKESPEQVKEFVEGLSALLSTGGVEHVRICDVDMKKMRLFCAKLKLFLKNHNSEGQILCACEKNDILISITKLYEFQEIVSSVLMDDEKITKYYVWYKKIANIVKFFLPSATRIGCFLCLGKAVLVGSNVFLDLCTGGMDVDIFAEDETVVQCKNALEKIKHLIILNCLMCMVYCGSDFIYKGFFRLNEYIENLIDSCLEKWEKKKRIRLWGQKSKLKTE